jgi:2-polyprenyl-6-methoxyphenol hydroxylase-like FAD-dependent oxidoreductase
VVTYDLLFDVLIVGAGLAGAAAAAVLGRLGLRVALVDPRLVSPPVFKAEKIEPDQADLLRCLGLMEQVERRAAPILEAALYRRQLATDRSALGWLRRRKTYADVALRGRCARLLGHEVAAPLALEKT